MTACTNKARGAVVAALAGALALGAVPAVALATGTGDSGVETLAVTDSVAFSKGKITKATNSDGRMLTSDELGSLTFAAGDYVVPQEVTPNNSTNPIAINTSADGNSADNTATVQYFVKDDSGTLTPYAWAYNASTQSWAAGNYVVRITLTSDSSAVLDVAFTVENASLDGTTLYDASNGDVSDTTFTYTGRDQQVGVLLDGHKLVEGRDYTIKIVAAGDGSSDSSVNPRDVGDYTACIWGMGAYSGKYVALPFSIGVLDLSTADVTVGDVTGATKPTQATINGVTFNESYGNIKIAVDGTVWDFGPYTATVSAGNNTKNVTGSATVTFNRVGTLINDSDITYDGTALNGQTPTVLLDSVSTYFDPAKISINPSIVGSDYDKYTVTVTRADGSAATIDDINRTAGVYKVSVRVTDPDYYFGSNTVTMTVTTRQGSIDANASLYFTFDGDVVSGTKSVIYDGGDMLDRLGVTLEDGDGNDLSEGSDYTVTVKDENGKAVDSVVNAGTYTVEVTSDVYEITGIASLEIDVRPFDLTSMPTRVTFPTMISYKNTSNATVEFVPYTGEDITPIVEVALTTDEDGSPVWSTLDADFYDFGFEYSKSYSGTYRSVDSVKELGYYTVSAIVDGKATSNFTGSYTSGKFNVSDQKVFVDVDSTTYYAPYVYAAVNQGYVEGMGGSNLFAPNASISRADMVCVLYRMAGGSVQADNWTASAEETEYLSQYSDVTGTEYFAQALAWASRTGVVTGYEDGRFGAADQITVEQFVTMLGRYAELKGDFDAPEDVDATLSTKADGSQVSGFAKEYVAWALDEGLIGRDGADIQPVSDISRGRSVTIAVRYQPEKLSGSNALFPSQN